ncbi:MAG: PBP1A family penicillin-binding protein [Nitrospinaceae bacterium]|nr:PBP1A family penicillin-binding protein [Nitrospinaceae bacterium]NIR57850.1 PBP1A family penicillin-binding protein [Nitrospinaceae bacterium]NIS87278.1 PBP1A family penicillin-binding protein [Nitrospinaceae bacterium]NIT84128.1 PBP1A family penicillin-binding protein [Nitrospinaceae bacterium]NIU46319.1 PBP1A family penicillin-binding protein [Nitrospinaceae bacterium]
MKRRLFQKVLFAIYVLILGVSLLGIGIYIDLKDDLPQLPDSLEKINLSLPTEIYSSQGNVIKVLGQRHPVPLEEISPLFTKAMIAAEDSRFYSHSGVDHIGLIRAIIRNIQQMRIAQGGSTITQQLSKNLFFSFERKWVRKIKELLIALQIEATFSKDEILEAYCNQVYFGHGAYGVEDASLSYFGKKAKDLTLLQAAMLAGLPNAPNSANPFRNPERAMSRTRTVLKRMVHSGVISKVQMEEALESELDLAQQQIESNPNQYFIQHVINQLEKEYGKEFVHFGGLKIYTTLDSRLQGYAHQAVQTHMKSLDKRMEPREDGETLQVAMVALENKTGAVRVLLGGRDYAKSQFNRAVSNNRMAGSSFKPVVYLTAMENLGISPATIIRDEPVTLKIDANKTWEPKNFNDEYLGDLILKKALMKSLNVISAKLVYDLTPERVIKTARQMGIVSPLNQNLSLALGATGVSPLEMAGAYSVIANLGILNEPYLVQRIEDYRGNTLYEHFYFGVQSFSQKSIYPLLNMMQGVVDEGTARVIRRMGFTHPAGGKTGTTNDYKDAWFDGFTRDMSASVWVGYDSNLPMVDRNGLGLTGGGAAAPIWAYFMKKALSNKNRVNFPVPEGIRFAHVHPDTGYIANAETQDRMEVAIKSETVLTLPPVQDGLSQGVIPNQETMIPRPANPNPVIEENVLPEF